MSRVYNFSAGPAVLPEEVLKEAAAEMLDYNGSGMSVMEMSHRSKPFQEIIETAEADIRELMNIPDNFKKIIVVKEDKKPWITEEGILVIGLKEFLMDQDSLDL